jgi:hypothetical protein
MNVHFPHPKSFTSSSAFGIFSKGEEKWMQSVWRRTSPCSSEEEPGVRKNKKN